MLQDVYLTSAGDMWDLISYQVYGTEGFVRQLVEANPQYVDVVAFGAGVSIVCPDVPALAAQPLPPWKQVSQ